MINMQKSFFVTWMSFLLTCVVTHNTWAHEGRHALIIGIGQYSEASRTPSLDGVPKDVENAKRMAHEMGIQDEQMTVLRDAQATKQNIIEELKRLSSDIQTGDRVFIYHSGHGTQYPKGDSCLQGLQTYTEGKFTYEDILTEQEIASYTRPISEKADKVIVMFDACFSGGVIAPSTRSLGRVLDVKPKFSISNDQTCVNSGVNRINARSLLSEVRRLGVQDENFVQIAAAKDNEVSWDNKDLGGLATHAMTQCLTGKAKDLNGSGAVSLDEVRVCAQAQLNEIMKPHENAGLLPSTIQVRGNRNLIPVSAVKPPVTQAEPQLPTLLATEEALRPTKPPAPALPLAVSPAEPARSELRTEVIPPALASIETLKDIISQRNPKRSVEVKMDKSTMKIGVDALKLEIKSSHEGYLYVVLLGSDAKSFYILYPNGLDSDNKISPQKPVRIPRPSWAIQAAGPAGTDQLLVMVSDSPRQLHSLVMSSPTASEPFTFALNDLGGRAALIDFLTGSGVNGRSESFGAKLVSVKEVAP
jgi:hypothetical protein